MSDEIPFEIQMEIIKKVSDLKQLIQLRSVSKEWKSFIDSPEFIASYGFRITHPHRLVLRYLVFSNSFYENKYLWLLDENDTLTQQQDSPPIDSDLIKQRRRFSVVVGISRGLWCYKCSTTMFVLWNPSIRRSVGIVVSNLLGYPYKTTYGFGVCPLTNDPTIVKVSYVDIFAVHKHNEDEIHWDVEIFTLSSKRWEIIPSSNLPSQSIRLVSPQVVIDRFIYWAAYDMIVADGKKFMIVSFDLVTKEFKVVDVPDSITNRFFCGFSISKLRESLILYGYVEDYEMFAGAYCAAWMMVHDGVMTSFTEIFVIDAAISSVNQILGFRENGEPVIESRKQNEQLAKLEVYEPRSRQITNLGIYGLDGTFLMSSCTESLLLLDHPDCSIY